MSTLVLELITTTAALHRLAPAWAELWHQVPDATPFQHPAWQLPWWSVFGTEQPIVPCLWEGSQLSGILPLYILERSSERKLLPIGIGLSDFCDALLRPDLPVNCLHELLQAALDAAGSTCDLTDIPPQARLRNIHAPSGWREAWRISDPCPVLEIPREADCVERVVPARQRRKLRMNRHRAARCGGWLVHDATGSAEMLEQLLIQNSCRWGHCDPAVREFLRSAMPNLARAGLARVTVLSIAGSLAAICLALQDQKHRLMFYMSGFEPAVAHVSPGSLLVGAMIDEAISLGRREIHFLRGGEAYKYAWGARDHWNAACRLWPA